MIIGVFRSFLVTGCEILQKQIRNTSEYCWHESTKSARKCCEVRSNVLLIILIRIPHFDHINTTTLTYDTGLGLFCLRM